MSKKGGYKIVSLGDLDLLDENLSLKGLYDALKVSYGKPILLTGIVIDGEHKKDALVQANEGANKINIKNLYGYDLEVAKSGDAITVSPSPDGIELPVPEPEDEGKVVKVNDEGKYVLGEDAGGMANPMTTANDLIVGGTNGAPTRLPVGVEGKLLKVGSSGIEWGDASSGGTKLYKHDIHIANSEGGSYTGQNIEFIDNDGTEITDWNSLYSHWRKRITDGSDTTLDYVSQSYLVAVLYHVELYSAFIIKQETTYSSNGTTSSASKWYQPQGGFSDTVTEL